MLKKFIFFACALLAAFVSFTACEATVEPGYPTGGFTPAPGIPGGGQLGGNYGIPDPDFNGFRFDASSFATMPSTAVWNALGHQHAFPDPFHFANGNKVVTKEDWEIRRKEISRILQFYEYGIMPSIREEDGVNISFTNSGSANTTFTVTYQGRTFTFTIDTTLPADYQESDRGNLGLYFVGNQDSSFKGGRSAAFPTATFASEANGSGAVPTLFGIDHTLPDSPSANMSYAWGMSVVLTCMEGIDLDNDGTIDPETEKAFRGWYNPNKVGISAASRGGKAVLCISAFAEGRNGSRVGHVGISSAGSGGPSLERFISPSGYIVNRIPADPLPLDQPGVMDYSSLKGKPWYLKSMHNGDATPGAGTPVVAPSGNPVNDHMRFRTVRGWSPYFEAFERTPFLAQGEDTTPFVGWQTPSSWFAGNQGYWGGIQSLSEGRNEQPGWFSVRFREFQDLHYGLDMDHVTGNEFRPPYGILCTIPFDQHYLSVLIAPRGSLLQEGTATVRNNPDSQFANWLIMDEVYKFLGEVEGDEYKYVWRNGIVLIHGLHSDTNGSQAADRAAHANAVFEDYDAKAGKAGATPLPGSATVVPSDYNIFKVRDPIMQVDDPLGRFDYYRMPWGRPNHPTIAERVKRRLPDALIAAYEADEINRPSAWTYGSITYGTQAGTKIAVTNPPASGTGIGPDGNGIPESITVSYNNWKTKAAAPDVPRFKVMDWRGLIDTPEALE